jgi:FdhE protein
LAKLKQALKKAADNDVDLAPYIELHRQLIRLQEKARAGLSGPLTRLDDQTLRSRLDSGVPLLRFTDVGLEAAAFARLAGEIAQALRHHEVDLENGPAPNSDEEWLELAASRFEAASHGSPGRAPAATIAQAAADLALRPYLERAAEQLVGRIGLANWKQGFCPVCGGEPDFASLDEVSGARRLLCSRCTTEWGFKRIACPFCGTTDHTKLSYFPLHDGLYRLYVCQECRRYLKTIDLRQADREVLLPLERITTLALDIAARSEGYS